MSSENQTPEEFARGLSHQGLTYTQIAGRFNTEGVRKDGERHGWTRTEVEELVTGAAPRSRAASEPAFAGNVQRSPRAASATTKREAVSHPPLSPTVVLDADTRRILEHAAESAARASNAAHSAASTFHKFFVVLIVYLIASVVLGITIGIMVAKEESSNVSSPTSVSSVSDVEECVEEGTLDEDTCEDVYG